MFSCVTQLIDVCEKWTDELDNKNNIDIIYLDFQKAFDTVPHQRLLKKLKGYGIQGKVLCWIESFLKNGTVFCLTESFIVILEFFSPSFNIQNGGAHVDNYKS